MKRYGMNQATEFSKKQISVVFAKAKQGNLKVEKWVMSRFYDLAGFYGMDSNGSVEREERSILSILESVFAGDLADAQERIDNYTRITFESFTSKAQASFNRSLVA